MIPLKGATRSAIRRAGAESTPRRRQIALAPTLARFRAAAASKLAPARGRAGALHDAPRRREFSRRAGAKSGARRREVDLAPARGRFGAGASNRAPRRRQILQISWLGLGAARDDLYGRIFVIVLANALFEQSSVIS